MRDDGRFEVGNGKNRTVDGCVVGWDFAKLRQVDPRLEFMGYSHFTLTSAVEAFVREAIQNSLDARRSINSVVKVNFRFGTAGDAGRDSFFGGQLEKHLGMVGALEDGDKRRFSELRGSASWDQPLRFLSVEDWGTLGIEGDHEVGPSKAYNADGNESKASRDNRFRYFHWAWGQSDPSDANRGGSWGYGKAALNYASKILTIMALSTRNQIPRHDSSVHQSLMGNSIIGIHSYMGDEYSFFGHYSETKDEERMPLVSETGSLRKEIEEFKKEFQITRGASSEDRGLSVIIPFPKDDFSAHSVSRAVLKSYFASIHTGQLVVSVSDEDNDFDWTFDKENIGEHLSNSELGWEAESGDKIDPEEIAAFIDLMERGDLQSPIELVPDTFTSHPSMRQMVGSLDEEDRKKYHSQLSNPNEAQTLTFRVDMPLQKSDGAWVRGCFWVTLAQRAQGKAVSLHRHIIRVTDDERLAIVPNGIIAMIMVPQKCGDSENALHTLLRSSEGPAHLSWRPDEGKVKDNWGRPTHVIPFVRRSALNIIKELSQTDGSEEVRPGWVQILAPKKGAAKKATAGGGGGVVVVESSSVPMDTQRLDRGISYSFPSDTKISNGESVKFEVAYEIRNGSPWTNHSNWDFDISAGDLNTVVQGGKITDTGLNHVTVEIKDKGNFELEITGFDASLERITRTSKVEDKGADGK